MTHVHGPRDCFVSLYVTGCCMSGFSKLWVVTQKWVAKFCQVGRQRFLEIFTFSHFFVNWIKNTVFLLPLVLEVLHWADNAQSSSKFWHHVVMSPPTLRELHASPRICQNVPVNEGPSPCKIISLLCFLICYTLFISPIQTSSSYDLHLKLIMLSHDHLQNLETVHLYLLDPAERIKLPDFICIIIAL